MADINPNNGVTYSHIVRAEAMIDYDVPAESVHLILTADGLNDYEVYLAWCAGKTCVAMNVRYPYNRDRE